MINSKEELLALRKKRREKQTVTGYEIPPAKSVTKKELLVLLEGFEDDEEIYAWVENTLWPIFNKIAARVTHTKSVFDKIPMDMGHDYKPHDKKENEKVCILVDTPYWP